MKRRKRRNLYLSILSVFLLLAIFAGSAFALSGDGTNIRHTGGGSAVSGDYLVPTSSSDHLVGYRFTWLTKDTSGNYASKSALDVFYKGYNPNSSWGYHIKATVSGNTYRNLCKYEYKRWFDTVTIDREYYTNSSYKYCNRTDIPVTLPADEAAMTTWGKVDANINTILNKMIPGSTVANMKAEDFVFIEPIYRVKIEGTNYCITVTEMGLIGCVVCSNTSTGNEGAGYGSGWVTIRRYTNFNWPDALKTTATHAGIAKGTALSSSSYATFENMVKKGFGLMAVWNSSPHVLTVYYQTGTGHSSLKISSNYKLASDFTSYSSSYIRTTSNGYFTQTVNYDNSLTLMQGNSSGFNLTRDYYTFSKWQLSGSSSKFNGGASVRASALNSAVSTSNQSATLVAVWAPINYTITYNLNGGKIGNSSVNPTQTYNYETDVYIGNYTTGGTAYTVPSKTGYTFAGWKYTGNTVGYWTKDNVYPNQYHKGVSEHGNITLTAQWTPITYTISYNANGGSGAPSSQTKTYGVNLTLSSTKPTRTGYTFSGWNTNSGGTGTSYSAGGTYTGNANLTLYAKWTPITYTVSYNANGGSGAPGNQTKTYGVDLTLSSTKPTRTGYTFVSWNTKADGTGTTYASGGKYTGNAALTLYAKWTPITYIVSYNANGGSGAPGNQTKTYGVNLTLSSVKPTRTGYTFLGWNTNSGGTGTSYAAGSTYSGNANLTLYAKWTPITYTVSYNANGGSGAPGNQTKTYGVDLTLSSTKPTRTGYTFVSWNTKADGTGTTYTSGGKYTGNAALTLYAIWTPITYTVSYNANGGSGAPGNQTKTYGVDLTLSSVKPSRTGYNFKEWNTKADGTGTSYPSGGKYTGNAALTLYAVWTPITYTVSYNANGGSGAPGNQTKTYGVDLTLSSTKPTRTGYTFVSWNTKADGTGTTYVSGGKYTGNVALTLYAVWTPITYTVSYNANGGSGAPGNQTKTYGVDLTLSSVKPSRTGYNFKEWNTKADGTGTSYPSGGKYTGNAPLLLYAIWTPKTYTVIYNANGGIGAPMMQVKTYGKDLTLSTQKPTRTGYTFVAWNTVANGTGRTYTPGQIYSDNSSVTLYAQWKTAYELRIEPIVPNAPYRCGTEVVTGFYLVNSGSAEVTPSQNVSVRIQISNGSNVIKNSTVSAVVPGNEKNLYYVKWLVPNGIGSVTAVANVIIEGSVTSTVSRTYSTCPNEIYSTPDTQYEASAPDSFTAPDVPGEYSQIKTWYVWSYQNNSFRRTNYGISIGDAKPAVTPDASANAVFSSGIWTMKSGYGFGLQMNNGVAPVSGYSMPDYGAYTLPQYAVALFPEFYYLTGQGKCRTLELNGNTWNFRQNATYGKIHFTPLWYPDGNYTAVVNQSDCWTPLGMISRQVKANTVIISGSAYDDWTIR